MGDFEKRVRPHLNGAVSIAFDTCHKIYILEDEEQHELMKSYGYDPLIRISEIGEDRALETLQGWFEESCALRFISSVRSVPEDPNKGFTDVIAQMDEEF